MLGGVSVNCEAGTFWSSWCILVADLFKNYSLGRFRFVKISIETGNFIWNHKSSLLSVRLGVPQGSVFEPALFILFIIALVNGLLYLFAGDALSVVLGSCLDNVNKNIDATLKVFRWQLHLNMHFKNKYCLVSKTSIVSETSYQKFTKFLLQGFWISPLDHWLLQPFN